MILSIVIYLRIQFIYHNLSGEMVDFGKSDKMTKLSEKVEKPTLTTDAAMIFRVLFEKKKTSSE